MKNTPKKYKVFLDTSVILSGLNSSFGASAAIISLFKTNQVEIIISREVIEEMQRVVNKKFPLLLGSYFDFLTTKPKIIPKPSLRDLKRASLIIRSEDTPILAGAIKSNADFLITLDKKFGKILEHKKLRFQTVTPAEFLQIYRK